MLHKANIVHVCCGSVCVLFHPYVFNSAYRLKNQKPLGLCIVEGICMNDTEKDRHILTLKGLFPKSESFFCDWNLITIISRGDISLIRLFRICTHEKFSTESPTPGDRKSNRVSRNAFFLLVRVVDELR